MGEESAVEEAMQCAEALVVAHWNRLGSFLAHSADIAQKHLQVLLYYHHIEYW